MTFFLSSLYFAWYFTSSAPAVMPATYGFDLSFAAGPAAAVGGIWWDICVWLCVCSDGPGEGWRDMMGGWWEVAAEDEAWCAGSVGRGFIALISRRCQPTAAAVIGTPQIRTPASSVPRLSLWEPSEHCSQRNMQLSVFLILSRTRICTRHIALHSEHRS